MRSLLFLVVASAAMAAQDAAFHLRSGRNQISLIELYTSEGCSSCPPAERWLARLAEAPGLWRDFVPVAFHVDYWNRFGWPDRFSAKANTQREYAYAAAWSGEFVALALVQGALGEAIALPQPKIPGAARRGLAVWVTRRGDMKPVQAVGGWIE